MLSKLIPWKWFVRRMVKRNKFLDPFELIARVRKFSQPSEVAEPIELLRAGAAFHARGLLNSRVIQHNLDWVWPFWVVRQFTPGDPSFVPRAFSLTHINLTHRDWTAVGLPNDDWYPVVDPRGLLTPELDGWSLDAWIVLDDGRVLLPSKTDSCEQRQEMSTGLAVETRVEGDAGTLVSRIEMRRAAGMPQLWFSVEAHCPAPGWVCLALRPCNPEGIQLVDHVEFDPGTSSLRVNHRSGGVFQPVPDRVCMADYSRGDVFNALMEADAEKNASHCSVGMCTAAFMYRATANSPVRFDYVHSHSRAMPRERAAADSAVPLWTRELSQTTALDVPDARWRFLYDAAVHTLLLLTGKDVYPGPYTYRRFWFRDACLMLHAFLKIGNGDRVEAALDLFRKRQSHDGYFKSQEGEWDSNGQVLWLFDRFREHHPDRWNSKWMPTIKRGADWICRKLQRHRRDANAPEGLLPAGFSAEHLGTNDYYYWDNLWSVAGLRSAAAIIHDKTEERGVADEYTRRADTLWQAIERSRPWNPAAPENTAWPAAPSRRMDSGAVGSLVADYPLKLVPPADPGMMNTVEFLLDKSSYTNGFFQDMIHSGINAYLTLDLAETLLRADDPRWRVLVERTAELASPTGHWPEAIHPHTEGGCMGDGQHAWAAAEWVLMMMHLFVREEGDELVLLPGLPVEWLTATDAPIRIGPVNSRFGTMTLQVETDGGGGRCLRVDAQWHRVPARVRVQCPGCRVVDPADASQPIALQRIDA